ncbi:nicotinamide N-methyltransferase [Exaiptasia diaphana]|uniref:Nicotinamide N-methyltransferase-like n=1 Tax=Exaiptasia diaphana TaxID=2652724 RepID=A0A913XVV1_EXADI|nr:nicotinamide N-methyltransferase [Exaiptasia diaphana]
MAVETTKDYQTFFDPMVYLLNCFDQPQKDAFVLRRLTDFWIQIAKDGRKFTNMLEYGTGPVVSRLINAAKHVQSIIAAEYLPANRQAMEDWINQDPKAFNWRPTFEYVVQKLEGMTPDEVEKREAEVREKIKAVVHCDVKAENHLEIPSEISAKYGPPFDIVMTCFCIEAAVESEKEYRNQIAYLAGLLRPGGYLVMHGVVKERFYKVGDKLFYSFPLMKEWILESMKDAGLKNINFDLFSSNFSREEFSSVYPIEDLKSGLKDHYSVYGQLC